MKNILNDIISIGIFRFCSNATAAFYRVTKSRHRRSVPGTTCCVNFQHNHQITMNNGYRKPKNHAKKSIENYIHVSRSNNLCLAFYPSYYWRGLARGRIVLPVLYNIIHTPFYTCGNFWKPCRWRVARYIRWRADDRFAKPPDEVAAEFIATNPYCNRAIFVDHIFCQPQSMFIDYRRCLCNCFQIIEHGKIGCCSML